LLITVVIILLNVILIVNNRRKMIITNMRGTIRIEFYYVWYDNFVSNDPKVHYIAPLRPLQNARVACINMRQHAADACRTRKIFHRTASVTPAKSVRVCRCSMVKLATVDQLSWPFCATTRARRVNSRNAPTFRAWKTFAG